MTGQRIAQPEPSGADGEWQRRKKMEWKEFGGSEAYEERIGEFAKQVDRDVLRSLTPGHRDLVLDLPCGAGRMSHELAAQRPSLLVSADYSPGMLARARRSLLNPLVRCDAFQLPFGSDTFDRILTLRLIFHYSDPLPILREAARVLRPGGELVFDTLNAMSTRHLAEGVLRRRGRGARRTGLSFLRPSQVTVILAEAGLQAIESEARYLLPTRLYRVLPTTVCRALVAWERLIPGPLRVLTYWRAEKPT